MGKKSGANAVHQIARMMREAEMRRREQKALEQRKRQAVAADAPVVSVSGPTPERKRADEWDDGSDKKGHRINAKTTPHLMRSRITRMQRDSWIDNEQAAALAAYEQLVEKAGYGNGRSCLDMTPRGGEAGTVRMDARRRLAEVRGEFTLADNLGALLTLDAILWPDPSHGPQTVTQVAVRLFPGRETNALKQVRRLVDIAGTQLAETLRIARVRRIDIVRAA